MWICVEYNIHNHVNQTENILQISNGPPQRMLWAVPQLFDNNNMSLCFCLFRIRFGVVLLLFSLFLNKL